MSGGSALYTERTNGPLDLLPEGLPIWDEVCYAQIEREAVALRRAVNAMLGIDEPAKPTRLAFLDALSCPLAYAIYFVSGLAAAVLIVYGITR